MQADDKNTQRVIDEFHTLLIEAEASGISDRTVEEIIAEAKREAAKKGHPCEIT